MMLMSLVALNESYVGVGRSRWLERGQEILVSYHFASELQIQTSNNYMYQTTVKTRC